MKHSFIPFTNKQQASFSEYMSQDNVEFIIQNNA